MVKTLCGIKLSENYFFEKPDLSCPKTFHPVFPLIYR